MIPKSDDCNFFVREELLSPLISHLPTTVVMSSANQFDRELRSRTVEIEGIRINRVLPTEYSPRSCGSADVAKEFARTRLLFCEVSGRGSQQIHLMDRVLFREVKLIGRRHVAPPSQSFPFTKGKGGPHRASGAPGGRAYLFILQTSAPLG